MSKRNKRCSCGSGRKFGNCCGAIPHQVLASKLLTVPGVPMCPDCGGVIVFCEFEGGEEGILEWGCGACDSFGVARPPHGPCGEAGAHTHIRTHGLVLSCGRCGQKVPVYSRSGSCVACGDQEPFFGSWKCLACFAEGECAGCSEHDDQLAFRRESHAQEEARK